MQLTTKARIVITAGMVMLAGTAFMLFTRSSFYAPRASMSPPSPQSQSSSPMSAVDRILETLELRHIAFNTPATIPFGDPAIIQLLLSTQESMETLQGMLHAVGETTAARIRVSNEMEARLTGQGFKIAVITPEAQAVSGAEVTEWQWEIEPTKGGVQ